MSEEPPRVSPSEWIATKRAVIADHPCPWCGETAWDDGALISSLQGDRLGVISFRADVDIPVLHQFVFTCTICTYSALFTAGPGQLQALISTELDRAE